MNRGSAFPTELLGIVVGLSSEAAIARQLSSRVLCSGGRPDVAARHARTLIDSGVTSLMSFGIAGGLAPDLAPGSIIVANSVVTDDGVYPAVADCADRATAQIGAIFGGDRIVDTPAAKTALAARAGAIAVDLESGPVAREAMAAGILFIALRAIADPVSEGLAPAALLPLDNRGRPILSSVLWSVLKAPGQIPGLIKTARDTRTALNALDRACGLLVRARG